MFPHMPTSTWREAGGIYCAVTEDAMNLHRISKDLISDHDASSEDYRPKDSQTYLEFKNFTARDHRAWRLPMAPMQTPRPTRRNSILGKGTRPAGGHTVPQGGLSGRARRFIGPNGYTNGYSGYYEVVPVVPVGPDYTYGYSPAPAYGGYYVVP